MPNRILREGIVTSERVNSLDWGAEVFYRRVMSIVDDFGRCEANAKLLLGTCYAMKLDLVALPDIERWIADCQRANLILLYEVSGKRFIELIDFKQQIRSKQSKHPAPDSGVLIECEANAKHVQANAHLDVGGGVGEDVSVFGDVGGGVGGVAETKSDLAKARPDMTRATQIAIFLRSKGIDGANAANPIIDEWARNPRVTDDLLDAAVSMVWARKPTRPGPNYMQHIVNDLLNPKGPNARASPQARSYHDDRADTIAQLTGRKPAHQPATAEAIDVDATEHTRKLG